MSFTLFTRIVEFCITPYRPPDKCVPENYLFLNHNICCGYSKEPSRRDGSFEHPKHMFKLMDKKIIAMLRKLFLLNWPYAP